MYPYFSAGYHVSAGVSPVGNWVLLVLQCSLQNDALEQGLIWATELKHWATTFHESGCPGTTMFWGYLSSTEHHYSFLDLSFPVIPNLLELKKGAKPIELPTICTPNAKPCSNRYILCEI